MRRVIPLVCVALAATSLVWLATPAPAEATWECDDEAVAPTEGGQPPGSETAECSGHLVWENDDGCDHRQLGHRVGRGHDDDHNGGLGHRNHDHDDCDGDDDDGDDGDDGGEGGDGEGDDGDDGGDGGDGDDGEIDGGDDGSRVGPDDERVPDEGAAVVAPEHDQDDETGAGPTVVPGPSDPSPEPETVLIPPARIVAAASVSAEVIVDCESSSVAVSIVNARPGPAVFDVVVPRSAVASGVTVPAGATTTSSLPLSPQVENSQIGVRVLDRATGGDLGTTVFVDCVGEPDPRVSITIDCPAGSLLVNLANRGDGATALTVIDERGSADRMTLPGGDTTTVEIPVGSRDHIVVLVLGPDGAPIFDRELAIDCPRPELTAGAAVDCTTGDVVVELANTGQLDGAATVSIGDRVTTEVVGSESSDQVRAPLSSLADDAIVTVTADNRDLLTTSVETDCVDPGVWLVGECHSLGLLLTNAGEGTARFRVEVTVAGAPALVRAVDVPPGSADVQLPTLHGADWRIHVSEDSHPGVLGTFSGADECGAAPGAQLTVDCGAATAVARVTDAQYGSRFVVLVDGEVVAGPKVVGSERIVSVTVELDPATETVEVYGDTRAGPMASDGVDCGSASAGAMGLAGTVVVVWVAISAAAALAWKGF